MRCAERLGGRLTLPYAVAMHHSPIARSAVRSLSSAAAPSDLHTEDCKLPGSERSPPKWAALVEERRPKDDANRVHVVELKPGARKVKGIGKVDPVAAFAHVEYGESVEPHGSKKRFVRLPARLPELNSGMLRRAQTISQKDAGVIGARLGIGAGDRILEAGLGSAGLAQHVARCLGSSGLHVTVEPRAEHAAVGLANLRRAADCWTQFPDHHHVDGQLEKTLPHITAISQEFDGIILDLPNHAPAITAAAPLLAVGGRLACYCPVTSQVEASWDACEAAGLEVEWAGEIVERRWGRASKGGLRPVNGPFGHTAFLLVAQRRAAHVHPPLPVDLAPDVPLHRSVLVEDRAPRAASPTEQATASATGTAETAWVTSALSRIAASVWPSRGGAGKT